MWPDELRDDRVARLNDAITSGNNFRVHLWETFKDVDVGEEGASDTGEESSDDEAVNEVHLATSDGGEDSDVRKRTKRLPDHGAEKRKRQVLMERAGGTHGNVDDGMKSFFEELFCTHFSRLEEKLDKKFEEGMKKLDSEISEIKNSLSISGLSKNAKKCTTKQSTANGVSKKRSSLDSGLL